MPLAGRRRPGHMGQARHGWKAFPTRDSAPDSAFPADLQRVINAWQHLSVRTKATILAILDAAGDAPSDA